MIQELIEKRCGFIKESEMPEVIEENRFQLILIRTEGGRFICHAQDAKHFIDIIEREKSDHIRDVSIFNGGIA